MALNTNIRAACLLLLLLASLTSGSVLPHQVRARGVWHSRVARTGEPGPGRGLLTAAGEPSALHRAQRRESGTRWLLKVQRWGPEGQRLGAPL